MRTVYVDGEEVQLTPDLWPLILEHGDEEYTWTMLDRDLRAVGQLRGASGGSLSFNRDAQTRGTGSVLWEGLPADQPDWLNIQLQPWYRLTTSRHEIDWPLGVFRCSTPVVQYVDGDRIGLDIDLYDRTTLLRERALAYEPYVVSGQGTPIVSHAREIIGYAGIPHLLEDDTRTTTSPRVWMPPTTFLRVVNDLLDQINYFAVYSDENGVMRSESRSSPAGRHVSWVFTDGDAKLLSYLPEHTIEHDWFSIPNRIIARSQGEGDQEAMIAEAYNVDRNDPLSIPNRGFVDEPIEDVDVTSQADLQAYAERALESRRGRASVIDLTHLPVPIGPNDRIDFERTSHDVGVSAVVRTVDIDCTPGATWKTQALEVKS